MVIYQRGESMDIAKNRNFSYRFFLVKLCQETSFFDIYERKQLFLDQKIEVLTRAKKVTFFKGILENVHFLTLFKTSIFSS